MGEFAGRLAVEPDACYAQPFEESRHDNPADGIDGVKNHLETGVSDGLDIDGRQIEHGVQVGVRVVLFREMAQIVHRSEAEILPLGKVQDSLPLGSGKKFTAVVQQFKRVPLARIVGSREDDASVCTGEGHGHCRGRC